MGATNLTPNYELSQFIGTDKPAWLQDYNGDMLKIDTGIAGAKTAADNAQSAADGAQGDATTALSDIANINTELGTVENTLSTATGNINTINSLIGNGTPTTTDQTIIGAINELHADELEIAGKIATAPTFAHLWKEDNIATVTSDGTMTRKDMLDSLFTQFVSAVALLDDNVFLHGTVSLSITGGVPSHGAIDIIGKNANLSGFVLRLNAKYTASGNIVDELYEIAASSLQTTFTVASDSTVTYFGNSAVTVPDGVTYELGASYYKVEKTIS